MFINTNDLSQSRDFYKVLVLGEPGTGKSTFADSFPGPICVLDTDEGISSYSPGVDYQSFELLETPESIRTKKYTSWLKFKEAFNELRAVQAKEQKYKTIVLDSVSTLSNMALQYAILQGQGRTSGSGGATLKMYGEASSAVNGVLAVLKSLRANIVFIGHTVTEKNDTTGLESTKLQAYGKAGNDIPALMDWVVFSDVVTKGTTAEYVLRLKPYGSYRPRFRVSGLDINELPRSCKNNYTTLFNLLHRGDK